MNTEIQKRGIEKEPLGTLGKAMASFLLSSGQSKLTIQEEPDGKDKLLKYLRINVRTAHKKSISKSSAKSLFLNKLFFKQCSLLSGHLDKSHKKFSL